MKDIKEICEEDNKNQKLFNEGIISKDTYNRNRERIHKDYTDAVLEEDFLKELIKKHGGN